VNYDNIAENYTHLSWYYQEEIKMWENTLLNDGVKVGKDLSINFDV